MIRSWQGHTPVVHPGAYVDQAAIVIGEVELMPGASVWPGTVIRGDSGRITVGRNTSIQDNSTIHSDNPATIGDNVAIGHNVLCHADRVGEWVLIGSGATVNGGVEIGDHSIIASGAVVLEGTRIPPCSFVVGVPARVKGPVTEKNLATIRETVEGNAAYARRYLEETGRLEGGG